ncbi:hypothetical protein MMC34_000128 [Xylographa carneopallida]|nr:hypothetical protein [Xylographa carneopallida]
MDRLPAEIVRNIFEYLDKDTIVKVASVCRGYRSLTTHYLARELHLIYDENDIKWLRRIADDPETAHEVCSIYFECDKLPVTDNKSEYLNFVIGEYTITPKPMMPEADIYGHVPTANQFKYYRDLHEFTHQQKHDYDEMELDIGWQMYEDHLARMSWSMDNNNPDSPFQIAKHTLVKMRNLRTLIFDSCNTFRPQSDKWQDFFHDGLTLRAHIGVQIFPQALKWVHDIGKHRTARPATLRIGLAVWQQCFGINRDLSEKAVRSLWRAVHRAVKHLWHLEMNWSTVPTTDHDSPFNQIRDCYEFFQQWPYLHGMVAAAPELEQLTLAFRPYWHSYTNDRPHIFYAECETPIYPPDRSRLRYMARLEDLFQTTRWEYLSKLKLWGVEAHDDEQLVAFFRRHPRIQHLDLKHLGLRRGSWLKVFQAIREPDRVSTCLLAGEFYSQGPPEEIWDLERPFEDGNGVFDERREKRRRDLQEWVCNRPRRPAPATGTTAEWRRMWGLDLEGVGYPYMSPLRWHLKP